MNISNTIRDMCRRNLLLKRAERWVSSVYIYTVGCAPFVTATNVQKWFVSFLRNVRGAKSSVKGHHFRMRGENKSLARWTLTRAGDRIYRTPGSMLPRKTFDSVRYLLSLFVSFFFCIYISIFFLVVKIIPTARWTVYLIAKISSAFPRHRKRHWLFTVYIHLSRYVHKITRISFRGWDESGLNRVYTPAPVYPQIKGYI